ncbi:MAG: hypothetical protein U0791_19250 [Gemmataceae bacterium]
MPDEPDNVIPAPDPLAEALARLEPAPAKLDRDRLMFAAGAESRRNTVRLWQAAAGFLAAIGFAAGVLAYTNTSSPFGRTPPPAISTPTNR